MNSVRPQNRTDWLGATQRGETAPVEAPAPLQGAISEIQKEALRKPVN
jgi:hypothetical protein